jgi:hypothetical protein
MMGSMAMGTNGAAGARLALAVGAAAVVLATTGFAGAQSQGKDLSDKSVTALISYAWAITPTKFTMPSGKEIIVDKAKPDDVIVPMETAREVIRVGRLTANAQICGLAEDAGANYQTLMAREQAKRKWSDQQTLFISQLHLFTVMMMSGKVQIVENAGTKEVQVQDNPKLDKPKADACSATERQKVKEQIAQYIKAEAGSTQADAGKKP